MNKSFFNKLANMTHYDHRMEEILQGQTPEVQKAFKENNNIKCQLAF